MDDSKITVLSRLQTAVSSGKTTTRENIDEAAKVNFKTIPDSIVSTDRFGFINQDNSNSHQKTEKEIEKENSLLRQWTDMMTNYEKFYSGSFSKLKSRTRKGVPDSIRGLVWQKFSSMSMYYIPGLFQSLINQKSKDEELDSLIIKDLDRTFPRNIYFRDQIGAGQRSLFYVLHAYASYNTATGYVQGMGFVTALLLTYMDEESAFFVLHSIMKKYNMEGFYLDGFPRLKKSFYCLLRLQKIFIPKVYQALKKSEIIPTLYAAEWFITLFSRDLPFDVLVRIFDVFFLEGFKVIYRFALAFLKIKEKEIIKASEEDGDIMSIIKGIFKDIEPQKLFSTAFGFSLSRTTIEKFESEYEIAKDDSQNEFIYML